MLLRASHWGRICRGQHLFTIFYAILLTEVPQSYDHIIGGFRAPVPVSFQVRRLALQTLISSAVALGYYSNVKIAKILEYRWKLLLGWWMLYTGIVAQRGYFGNRPEHYICE